MNTINDAVITSASSDGATTTTIGGTLNSTASTTFRLEFFASLSCYPSGNGEGQFYLGTSDETTDINGDGIDRFRIKIWDKATDIVIYDNQMGASEYVEPSTELGGGSIVIHSAK